MKRLIVILFAIIATNAFCQNWQWQNPKPTGSSFNCVDFFDNNTGYAATSTGSISDICALNASIVVAVGGAGCILKSVNGGSVKRSQFSSSTPN